jgi:hypothetical protein
MTARVETEAQDAVEAGSRMAVNDRRWLALSSSVSAI